MESVWYYAHDGAQTGPVSFGDLSAAVASGQLGAEDLVWKEGTVGLGSRPVRRGTLPDSGTGRGAARSVARPTPASPRVPGAGSTHAVNRSRRRRNHCLSASHSRRRRSVPATSTSSSPRSSSAEPPRPTPR